MPVNFKSIIAMASNAAKQTKLLMAADPSAITDDENDKKKTFLSCKTTSAAASCAPPSSIRSDFPDIKMLGIYFGIYLSVGTTSFYTLRNHMRGHKTNDFIDSLYLCVVTMTTVGYGDIVPHSIVAQLVCSVLVTAGMCLVGIAVKIAANYLVVKQQMVLVNALHMARKLGPKEALNEIGSLKINYDKCLISLIAMAVHFVVGVFVLVTVEGMDFTDAIYCACSTMTTVGFGDESFSSEFGRMFGVFWISTGTSCLGQLFLYIAEVYTDIETRKLVKWVITSNIIAKKDLEDGKVKGAADLILHKLKEMGKIKQEDISVAMKGTDHDLIKDLDVDDQPASNVIPAQSSENK